MTGLLHSYLVNESSVGHLEANEPKVLLNTMQDQLELAKRLSALIRVRRLAQRDEQASEEEIPLLPLPVRLFVEKAISLLGSGRCMDDLPTSLPEIFADHLRAVNPSASGIEHCLSEDPMLKVAKVVAKASLGNDYISKEVARERLEEALKVVEEVITESDDPLKRLELNGVLTIRRQGTAKLYRFVLDPMAEYIGAEAIADDCGAEREKWRTVLEKCSGAPGFQFALRLTLQAYGPSRGWPSDL